MAQDRWNVNESDNRLGWFIGTVTEDYYSDSMTESGGKATFQNADQVARFWKLTVDDVIQEYDGKVPEEVSIKLGLGKGWEKTPDGTAVRHEDDDESAPDDDADFKASSGYGQLVALCIGKRKEWKAREVIVMDGGDEVEYDFSGVTDYMRANDYDDPREAGIWVGTKWLFRGLALIYNEGDEPRTTPKPVAFLGTSDAPTGSTGGAGKASSAKGKVEVDPEDVGNKLVEAGAEPTDEQVEQLAKLLETSPNHAAFARNALAIVGNDEALRAAVMDQGSGAWSVRGG